MVILGNDWDGILADEWEKPYYRQLHSFLKEEYSKMRIYPDMYDIFNALKYTPTGEISVYFENGRIVIKDTGIGIAAEDLPRIFENGYTGCNGRRDRQASGLGLYLCRQICENLGHKISAESAVGEGTTVLIDVSRKKTVIE